MTDDFGGPAAFAATDWKGYYGHLLVIWPYSREEVSTRFGEKPAIRADIYDLDADGDAAMDALVFPRALVMQLSGVTPGRAVVGRLGQGESRGGQAAPWKLANPTPDDLQRAAAHFANRPARIHSVLNNRASNGAQPAPQPQPVPQQVQSSYPAPPTTGATGTAVTFEGRPPF